MSNPLPNESPLSCATTGRIACRIQGNAGISRSAAPLAEDITPSQLLGRRAQKFSADRVKRAVEARKADEYAIVPLPGGRCWHVVHRQDARRSYMVDFQSLACSCPDFQTHVVELNRDLIAAGKPGTQTCHHCLQVGDVLAEAELKAMREAEADSLAATDGESESDFRQDAEAEPTERRYSVKVFQGDGTKFYFSLLSAPWNEAEERVLRINASGGGGWASIVDEERAVA